MEKPSGDFLNKYTSIIVDCRHCCESLNPLEQRKYKISVQESLIKVKNSTTLNDNLAFNAQAENLCLNCDYHSPRIFNLLCKTLD